MSPRVVVVCGGSAGVGRAAARAFARRGDWVAILARDAARVEATCAELRELGATTLGIPLDVGDADAVEAAAARIERELGRIDVWVNNASATVFSTVAEMRPEEYERVMRTAYLGCVHGTLAALRRMQPRNAGCIVQTGSALAYQSIPLQSAYCAAKAASRAFTDALRCELRRQGSKVGVTMVHLSAFNTPQFDWSRNRMPLRVQPVPPIFQPEVAAEGIVHASLHPRKREWWVGWPAVKAILGSRLVPALVERMVARQAWDGQLTDEPASHDRPDNLEQPVEGEWAARGRFDARARRRSWQWTMSRRRWPLAAALTVTAATAAAVSWMF